MRSAGGVPGLGGGIANTGTLALTATSVLSNSAALGGGLANLGALDALDSTISGNIARDEGGGMANGSAGRLRRVPCNQGNCR